MRAPSWNAPLLRSEPHADGEGARFRLVTNWQIDRSDALRDLIHQRSHTLRLDRMFAAGGDRSAMGRVRKLWREHLGLTEEELRLLARTLAFSESPESLEQLRESLDPLLRIAGLRRVPLHESASVYDDVVFQWMGQGRLEFNRSNFRSACEREGLIADGGEPAPKVYGVKSFEHATDRLEDRCTAVLDLIANFDDRQLRSDSDWQQVLYPALKVFLLDSAKDENRLRLALDAHLTLSFAAGSVLNIKSGRIIELEQRTLGRRFGPRTTLRPIRIGLRGFLMRKRSIRTARTLRQPLASRTTQSRRLKTTFRVRCRMCALCLLRAQARGLVRAPSRPAVMHSTSPKR